MKTLRNRRGGAALVVTLLVLLAISAIGAGLVIIASTDVEIAGNVRSGEQALYYADAGIQLALTNVNVNNTAIPPAGFAAVIYPSGGGYQNVVDPSNNPVPNAQFQVTGETNVNNNGFSVVCNIPGFSIDYGQRTFHFTSTGIAGSGTSRQVDAIVYSQPQSGVCPPGMGKQY